MDLQTPFLIALGVTLGMSCLIIGFLWRPFYSILVELCGTATRARFWRSYTNILLILFPVGAVMTGRAVPIAQQPLWLAVSDDFRWAILGLLLALFVVALGVVMSIQSSATVSVSKDQVDDLHRLLEKVNEIRARQILRHADDLGERRA